MRLRLPWKRSLDGTTSVSPSTLGQASTLRALAETTGHVGDASFARALAPYVAPYQGQLLVAFNCAVLGSAPPTAPSASSRSPKAIPTRRSSTSTPLSRLEDRFRAPTLATRTRYWLTRALRQRGEPGDHQRAKQELTVAARTAHDLGLIGIQHLIDSLDPDPL